MTKILILGSKPGAILPTQVDHVYAANASAHFYRDKILSSSDLTIVASAGEIYNCDLKKQPNFSKIVNSVRNGLIVSGIDEVPGAQEKIAEEIHVKNISYLSSKMRRNILNSVVGWGLMAQMLLAGLCNRVNLLYVLKYAYYLSRSELIGKDAPPRYRPSTGLFALAYAIKEHSKECQYIVAGIGFERRNEYPDGSKLMNGDNLNHLIPDMICLTAISRKYKISTTDSSISELFSIPLV